MLKEKKLFTIGQFASLHEINKKTLMWYDEIGLLKPAAVKENGYRCYSCQQSTDLEIILMLRELNVSLEEIRQFMENRTIDSMEALMKKKIEELDQTISHLRSIRKLLCNHQKDMEALRSLDLSEISLIKKESHYLASVLVTPDMPMEKEIEQVIAETKKYQLRRLHDASYGSMIPVSHLYQGNFDQYTALYIEIPFPVSKKGLHVQPSGSYLRAFHKGSWDSLSKRYQEILSYADRHGLELWDHAYETGLNDLVISRMEDYITQIEIPVRPIS